MKIFLPQFPYKIRFHYVSIPVPPIKDNFANDLCLKIDGCGIYFFYPQDLFFRWTDLYTSKFSNFGEKNHCALFSTPDYKCSTIS